MASVPNRPIVKVSPEEVVVQHAVSNGVNLSDTTVQLLSPIVGCMTRGLWVDKQLVTSLAQQATPDNFDAAAFIDARMQTMHTKPDADRLVHQDANGGVSFSPVGFGHALLQLPGPEGDDLRALFSSGNTGEALEAAVNHVRTARQTNRNNLAEVHNRNTQAIVSTGVADAMFQVREEKRFYQMTLVSTEAALVQNEYPVAMRAKLKGSSLRAALSMTLAAGREVAGLVQEIALRNNRPGGPLADQTPQQMQKRLRAINDGGARSYNAPRPTIAKRRDDAFVRYVA